ncbi:MAG: hypothetical protein AAF497_08645, partial [Planctomycetota bacterium]
ADLLAYQSNDNRAVVVDLATGEEIFSAQLYLGTCHMALSMRGNRLAVCTSWEGRKLIVWDVASGKQILNDSTGGSCHDIVWHSNENELALTADYDVQIWDVEAKRRKHTLKGHSHDVFTLAYMKDQDVLFSSSWGHKTIMWNTTSGKQLLLFGGTIGWSDIIGENGTVGFHRGNSFSSCEITLGLEQKAMLGTNDRSYFSSPRSLAVHPSGRLAVLSTSSGIQFADPATGVDLGEVIMGYCRTVTFDPQGKFMISTDHDRAYRWNISNEDEHLTIGPPERIELPEKFMQPRPGTVCSAVLDPDCRTLTVSRHRENDGYHDFCQVDLENERPPATFELPFNAYPISSARNGTQLMFRNRERCFTFDTTKQKEQLLAKAWLVGGSISRSGRLAGVVGDEVAFVYELERQEKRFDIDSDYEFAWAASFSDDESLMLVAVKSPSGSLVVDTETGKSLAFIPAQPEAIPRDIPPIWVPKTERIVTFGEFNELISWDWNAIRKQLVDLGLDWESSDNANSCKADCRPIRLTINMDSELRQYHAERGVAFRRWSLQSTYDSVSERLARDPDNVILLIERARLVLDKNIGMYEQARRDTERAIKLEPQNEAARYFRCQLARRQSDWETQNSQFESLLEFAPEDRYRLHLIRLLTLSPDRYRNLERAAELIEDLDVPDRNSNAYTNYAYAMASYEFRRGQLAKAAETLAVVVDRPSASPVVAVLMARIQLELGRDELAEQSLEKWDRRLANYAWGPRTFRYAAHLLTPWYDMPSDESDGTTRRYSAVEVSRDAVPNSGAVTLGGFPRRTDLGTLLRWEPRSAAEMSLTIRVDQSGTYDMTAVLAAWSEAGGVSFELNGSPIGQNPIIEKSYGQGRIDRHAIGQVKLVAGENTLIVRAHPSRATSKCGVGIAYLEFTRMGGVANK